MLGNNINKINWYYLSENPAAINLIRKNLDKVDLDNLSNNPVAINILVISILKQYESDDLLDRLFIKLIYNNILILI